MFVAVLLLLLIPASAMAQGITSPAPMRPFVGAGVSVGSNDAHNRIRFPDGEPRRVWQIEAGVPIRGRLAAGLELADLGRTTGGTSGRSFELVERQDETLVQGVARVRLWSTGPLSADVVAGAGSLVQHRDTVFRSCGFNGTTQVCSEIPDREARHSLALSTGLDLPLTLARHLSIAGLIRILALRRGDFESSSAERRSSMRVTTGVAGRMEW